MYPGEVKVWKVSWPEVCSAHAADGIGSRTVYCQAWHHIQSLKPAPLNLFNAVCCQAEQLCSGTEGPTCNDLLTSKRENLMAEKRTNK